MDEQLKLLLTLALAVSACSMTLTKAKVFKGAREWVGTWSRWLYGLATCPYCMSHWLAFAAVAAYRPRPVRSGVLLLDLAVAAFAIIALAAFSSGVIYRAFVAIAPSDE